MTTPTLPVDAVPPAAGKWGFTPKRGFLLDTLTVSLFAILAKIAGASKAVVIARVFGSGTALDSYLLAFLIPSVLADTFCGALVPVTVPRLVELDLGDNRASSVAFYARVLRKSLSFALLGTTALAIGIGASLLFVRILPPAWHAIGILTLLMLPIIPCNAVANVWRAALNSQRNFAIPAVTVVLTPAVIMLCVLFAGRFGGIRILAIGTTLGAVAELALLGAAVRGLEFPVMPTEPAWKHFNMAAMNMDSFRKEYLYLAASAAVAGGTVLIGQTMAASLGAGSVSVLNYGTRLAGVLLAIGPAALSVTVLPRFSAMVAERDWETLKSSLRRMLLGSAAISGIAAIGCIAFSAPIVRLTLQRGAFTAADTGAVAAVQAWSLLQMPFVVGITILMRVFSALKANRPLLPLCASALVVNLALNFVFMHRFGVPGISLASSIAQGLLFAALTALVFGPGGSRLLKERG